MIDEPVISTQAEAPSAAPVAAPAQTAPVQAATEAPAPAAVDVAAPVPGPTHPSEIPTLLEDVGVSTEALAQPAVNPLATEPVNPAPEAKADAKLEAPAPPASIEYKFEMPEGIQESPEEMAQFTGYLNEARAAPEIGQKMLNLHAASMQKYAEGLLARQIETFNKTRENWRKESMADEQIGGSGHDTAMKAIRRARDLLVSDAPQGSKQHAADRARFDEVLRVTGVGDHPAFLRMLHNMSRYIEAPAPPPPNPKPPPGLGAKPNQGLAGIYK